VLFHPPVLETHRIRGRRSVEEPSHRDAGRIGNRGRRISRGGRDGGRGRLPRGAGRILGAAAERGGRLARVRKLPGQRLRPNDRMTEQ
jgi:hypothetical protein